MTKNNSIAPHSCSGCGRRWTGTTSAHCMACHEHFSTVDNFDKHVPRPRAADGSVRCGDPATMTRERRDGRVVPVFSRREDVHGVRWIGYADESVVAS